jgi:bifunctional polynucleotide phosphatase/kinase
MWNNIDSVYYLLSDNINKCIAGFDLDHTLIKPKLKNKFPKNKDDWKFIYNIDKINILKNKYNIIIITNQSRFNDDLKYKFEKIYNMLNISIFVSTENDIYRKPLTGIWNIINKLYKNINIDESFYCGDAAGRKSDFSISDYMFAKNIGINFYTPEGFFINSKQYTKDINYINRDYYLITNNNINIKKNNKEIILFVGYPGSGKSYLAKQIGYEIISQDFLKTKNKCLKLTEINMKQNNNIIIDNTNINKLTRLDYIKLAQKYNYYVKCIIINNSIDFCNHMNYYRVQQYNKKVIPIIVYRILKKKYEYPLLNEGIHKIIEIENKLEQDKINLNYYFKYNNI